MPEAMVRVRTGTLIGRELADGFEFLGIPFAQSPVGSLAFEPPRPLPSSDEIVRCEAYGATFPRAAGSSGFIPEPAIAGSNYLNLNVWTPSLGAAGLPVFVWIHGGGFVGGSNASPWYHGAKFARSGVVAVTINYRLGAEGFLQVADRNSNRGLLDMLQALQWVQDNVAAFGGDPARVTIGGQSAGASSCLALFTSSVARGLFRRSIVMSSGGMIAAGQDEAASLANDFAETLGVGLDAAELASVPLGRRVEADRRYQPSAAGTRPIWEGARGDGSFGKETLVWRPVVDGDVIEADAYSRARGGYCNGEALLIGTTAEEFNGAVAAGSIGMSKDEIIDALRSLGLDQSGIDAYLSFGMGRGSLAWALAQAFTDWRFRIPATVMADAAKIGGIDVFKYEFRFAARVPGPGAHRTQHSSDLPFVFDNLSAPGVAESVGEDAPQGLADEMHQAWVRFVEGNDPWAKYDLDGLTTMTFDGGSHKRGDVGTTLRSLWGDSVGSSLPLGPILAK
jgi:para-nitrobenzyl esterase